MKSTKRFNCVAAITLFVIGAFNAKILLASDQNTSKSPRSIAVGQEIEGYQLAISTTNNLFTAGDPLVLTVSLKNISTNSLPVLISSSWFNDFQFEIVRPDGKKASLTASGKRLGVNTLRGETSRSVQDIASGAALNTGFVLNDLFEMVEPGEYTITVTRKPWGKPDLQESLLRVSSAPLKVWITEPPHNSTPMATPSATNVMK